MAIEPIFEAGPLISSCKYAVENRKVIDFLTPLVSIMIPAAVHQEVVIAGSRYPDAAVAQQRVNVGSITVETPQLNPDLAMSLSLYELGKGETEAILLTAEKMVQSASIVLVVDDILAYVVCDRMKINKVLFLDFLLMLTEERMLDIKATADIVRAVRSRYPKSFVDHTLHILAKR